ncbi:hypothetical protein DFH27DRAFT_522596 [Peziza echinospora]|nr:hypothetical protein DFH27DRAFT_522596 [Peziza echinospora]
MNCEVAVRETAANVGRPNICLVAATGGRASERRRKPGLQWMKLRNMDGWMFLRMGASPIEMQKCACTYSSRVATGLVLQGQGVDAFRMWSRVSSEWAGAPVAAHEYPPLRKTPTCSRAGEDDGSRPEQHDRRRTYHGHTDIAGLQQLLGGIAAGPRPWDGPPSLPHRLALCPLIPRADAGHTTPPLAPASFLRGGQKSRRPASCAAAVGDHIPGSQMGIHLQFLEEEGNLRRRMPQCLAPFHNTHSLAILLLSGIINHAGSDRPAAAAQHWYGVSSRETNLPMDSDSRA